MEKKRGGGPKSTTGKQKSSQNATKHGGRSQTIRILPDEDPEEFERVKNGWLTEYEPEGHMEETLAENLIDSEWLLLRARRNRFNAEVRAVGEGKEPHEWTAEDNHQVELMQRYLTTAERSFYRAFNAMQGLRKDIMREKREARKLEIQNDELRAKISRLEAAEQNRPAAQASSAKLSGEKASSAKASGGKPKKQGKIGHLQGGEIMPRPEEHGGCDCESCRRAKARIAAQGR